MQARHFGLIVIATLGLGVTFSPVALAGQGTVTGPNGRTTTANTSRQNTDNGTSFQRTTTWPNGQTSTGSGSFTRTGNGGYTRNVGITGPNGQQTTINGAGTYQNGALNGTRTIVHPNGQPRTSTFQYSP